MTLSRESCFNRKTSYFNRKTDCVIPLFFIKLVSCSVAAWGFPRPEEDTMTRQWEERWESIKVNENKVVEQELDDENRQSWFSRHRPNGFVVNEKEHIIYVLELTSFRHRGMCP